jgi:hypothetical protein
MEAELTIGKFLVKKSRLGLSAIREIGSGKEQVQHWKPKSR